MANPQPSDAHLRVAHSIQEQIMVSRFTEQQRRILDLILRLSWGCGKKTALIPRQRDFEVVGVLENKVRQHLNFLIEAKVIIRDGAAYAFNKDFDDWRVSRALAFNQQRLASLVRLNLNGKSDDEFDLSITCRIEKETCPTGKVDDSAFPRKTSLKGKQMLAEKGSSSASTQARLKKSKESNDIDMDMGILNFWNIQKIIQHRRLTSKIERAIQIAVKDYTPHEICQAIQNYGIILNGDYRWDYRWTLEDFLARGMAKFLDLEVAKKNYAWRKGEKAGAPHDRQKYVSGRYGHVVKRRLDDGENESRD